MPSVPTNRCLRAAILAVSAAVLAACAATEGNAPEAPGKKLSDTFATPDWANFTGAKTTSQRAITPDDLVSADGRCAGAPEPAAATTEGNAPDGEAPTTPAAAPVAAPPPSKGGIGLAMTECQVVQRAGTPGRIDIGSDGERSVTLSYMQGPWPGIYKFRSGRLVTIERVDPPAPEPKSKKQPAKPAKKQVSAPAPSLR